MLFYYVYWQDVFSHSFTYFPLLKWLLNSIIPHIVATKQTYLNGYRSYNYIEAPNISENNNKIMSYSFLYLYVSVSSISYGCVCMHVCMYQSSMPHVGLSVSSSTVMYMLICIPCLMVHYCSLSERSLVTISFPIPRFPHETWYFIFL